MTEASAKQIINSHFEVLLRERLRITKKQRDSIKTRTDNAAKCLHEAYYDTSYNGRTKLIIGSVAKHTVIKPLNDVDMLFKMPRETFKQFQKHEGNGPADLLQDVKNKLGVTYPLTEKHGWVKVVTLEFASPPQVEILPALELEDDTFLIPNSSSEGKWEMYDARAEINRVAKVPSEVRNLIKLIKHWRDGISISISSYTIENLVLDYCKLDNDFSDWAEIVMRFFVWLSGVGDENIIKPATTAAKRIHEAIICMETGQYDDACSELQKVFPYFPSYNKKLFEINKLSQTYHSDSEEYIEDLYPVEINPEIELTITAAVTVDNKHWSGRQYTIPNFNRKFDGNVPPNCQIRFTPRTNYTGDITYLWKVRNFGEVARKAQQLRGEIKEGNRGDDSITEPTLFPHPYHYVECYVIENGVCIARKTLFVPIGGTND